MGTILTEAECTLLDLIAEERNMGEEADLTDWEIEFIDDNLDRYDDYGERTKFTERQWEIIHKIAGKLNVA
jgi:hypothetical protein